MDPLETFENYLSDAGMLRLLLDNIHDGVYFTDRTRTIRYWNKGAEVLSGYPASEVVGRRCADNILMHVDDEGTCLCTSPSCPLVKCLKGETDYVQRVFMHHKDGHRVPVRICASPIRNQDREIVGGVESFYDISEEMTALKEMDHLRESALLCPLTGVGNRRYCEQMLEDQLQKIGQGRPSMGLLFMDIDNFKSYNDRYGHAVGDIVLKMVARTISKSLRSIDFVGRWGGEEFMVILPRMLPASFEQIADRLRVLISTSSADVSKERLQVTVSIGATMGIPGESAQSLVERADHLMYKSKQMGKDRVTLD